MSVSPASGASSLAIATSSVTLSPSQPDYEAGYIESTSPSGIEVTVTTDNPSGVVLYIRSDDASPELDFSDLLVKCPTGGSAIPSYTPISGTDQSLWSTASPVTDQSVYTDIRVQDVWSYPDSEGGGRTPYVDTLTYTVVEL